MRRKKKGQEMEIIIPNGYEPEEMLDTDDAGYGLENELPAYTEEVKLIFERKQDKKSAERIR